MIGLRLLRPLLQRCASHCQKPRCTPPRRLAGKRPALGNGVLSFSDHRVAYAYQMNTDLIGAAGPGLDVKNRELFEPAQYPEFSHRVLLGFLPGLDIAFDQALYRCVYAVGTRFFIA